MNELQQQRRQFKESNPGFNTPLWVKLGSEAVEALSASWKYFRNPTSANRHHLGEELSDMIYIIYDMANKAGLDIERAMRRKLEKDKERFPPGTVMVRRDYRKRKMQLGER